ncbi:MAG: hypothetical protein HC838_04145 [Spirulinaceae cyanobacterium RM2_2_10]|nr:hypothetical protein [Spirulinaceae cyanobacterium SM2_1_0]NJO19416.1 hypothetical protein [Spirulinaceae cyanobacterium RM2_2_10]
MDRLDQQREAIHSVLQAHLQIAERNRDRTPIETFALTNAATDDYFLLATDYKAGQRVYGVLVHLRLHDGKIVVEQNNVEDFIEDLIDLGVPEDELVTGSEPGDRAPRQISV